MQKTFEQRLEALRLQVKATTPGPWGMDDDPRYASLFARPTRG